MQSHLLFLPQFSLLFGTFHLDIAKTFFLKCRLGKMKAQVHGKPSLFIFVAYVFIRGYYGYRIERIEIEQSDTRLRLGLESFSRVKTSINRVQSTKIEMDMNNQNQQLKLGRAMPINGKSMLDEYYKDEYSEHNVHWPRPQ